MPTSGARVLVIDDESQIRKMLKVALKAHGYEIEEASLGQEGLEKAAVFHPDLIILDLGLPDVDGFQVINRLREWSQVPVIILSVKEQEEDKIKALDAGADDYVTKPFSMGELLARVRVALRHAAKTEDEPVLTIGELTIDLAHRLVTVGGQPIKLTPTEYDILKNLALHAGRVLTHQQLLRSIWGKEYQEENHYLRVYIGQLRRKIEPDPTQPTYIITEPGVGYRLMAKD
ncbi:MAG: two-component system, OmpR family, operon response regulator KdpE [Clostridia bacterium]|jgi:two-component system KDP operon response regulator KdpE|nr:kdpE 3 [Clostridiales bacterium]MDK2986111.1 two-component system, OmpR family, operon response regulator KdpE [Clostridia bacterium]